VSERHIFRVQDSEGRGPYRPGFSRFWTDPDGPVVRPWWDELGIPLAEAVRSLPVGMYSGCGFRSLELLNQWFTPIERERLQAHGFVVVRFKPDRIIAQTPTQVVFAQRAPLFGLPVYGPLTEARAA